jgi:hypothetical protein
MVLLRWILLLMGGQLLVKVEWGHDGLLYDACFVVIVSLSCCLLVQ